MESGTEAIIGEQCTMDRYKLGFWCVSVTTDNETGVSSNYRIPFRYSEEYNTQHGGYIGSGIDQRANSITIVSDTRLEMLIDGYGLVEISKDDGVELADGKTRLVTKVDKIPNGRGGYSWTRRIYLD